MSIYCKEPVTGEWLALSSEARWTKEGTFVSVEKFYAELQMRYVGGLSYEWMGAVRATKSASLN